MSFVVQPSLFGAADVLGVEGLGGAVERRREACPSRQP